LPTGPRVRLRHIPDMTTVIAGSLVLPRQPRNAHDLILRTGLFLGAFLVLVAILWWWWRAKRAARRNTGRPAAAYFPAGHRHTTRSTGFREQAPAMRAEPPDTRPPPSTVQATPDSAAIADRASDILADVENEVTQHSPEELGGPAQQAPSAAGGTELEAAIVALVQAVHKSGTGRGVPAHHRRHPYADFRPGNPGRPTPYRRESRPA
jgi:hypothetical protein